jgi:hypothetical protein
MKLWWLYHLRFENNNECFDKIGITSKSVQERFPTENGTYYKNYEMKIIDLKRLPKDECLKEEKRLHLVYKELHYVPLTEFSGSKTECFETGLIQL